MPEQSGYDAWKAHRARRAAPDGFAERVMAALPATHADPSGNHGAPRTAPFVTHPLARAALMLLAASACLFRVYFALVHLLP